MLLSASSIAAIKVARIIYIITDATGDTPAYFIATQSGDDARDREATTNSDGGRWGAESKQAAIEAVQAIRPELESHDLAAGVVSSPGPSGYDLDRQAVVWLLTLSGKRITELDDDERMLLAHGYTYRRRLGVNVSFSHTGVEESTPDPRKLSVIEQQLRAIGRGDQCPPIYQDNAIIHVSHDDARGT